MKNLIVVMSTFLAFISFEIDASTEINVGISKLEFVDKQRTAWDRKNPRPVVTHIYYPTLDKGVEPIKLGAPGKKLFVAGKAAWNAKPIQGKKLPLVIVSHGTGGSGLQMLWVAQKLVERGYVVAAVNHHGNTSIEAKKYAEAYILWWERAEDLSVVLDKLSDNDKWSKIIDVNRVGLIGFSLGGYTAVSAIGGITDMSLFENFCQSEKKDSTCDAQVEFPSVLEEFDKVKDSKLVKLSLSRQHHSYKNEKFKAAFVISPAVAQAFTEHSLTGISIPTAVVVGSNDEVAPAISNAKRLSSLIKSASYSEVQGAGHYTFLSECTDLGRKYLANLCVDLDNVSRKDVHEKISDEAVEFFNAVFTDNNALQRTSH